MTLLVVGAGRLGLACARRWRTAFPDSPVIAETRTDHGHAALRSAGCEPRRRDDPAPRPASHLLFAVPPSAATEYAAEAARAIALWDGSGGALIVSSTAVYAEQSGGWIAESSPLADHERARRLLQAEEAFRARGGSIARLAGLYSQERGPHLAYRHAVDSTLRPDAWLNLIQEDDAARLCTRALEVARRQTVLLGCDGTPLTRAQLWEVIARGEAVPFHGTTGPLGRRCNNGWTRGELGWEPRFRSFADWWRTVS